MRRGWIVAAVGALVVLAAPVAGAQEKTKITSGPKPRVQGGARTGGMPAHVDKPDTNPPQRRDDGYGGGYGRYYYYNQGRVNASYILLGDGTILASYGDGYQEVLRNCASTNVGTPSGSMTVIAGGGRQLQSNSTLQSNNYPVASACWTTDASGRILIARP